MSDGSAQRRQRMSGTRRSQVVALVLVCIASAYAFSRNRPPAHAYEVTDGTGEMLSEPENALADPARFDHSVPMHDRMPCLLCHVRAEGRMTPKMPGHTPCAACHTQQFADAGNVICTICHTNASTGALKRFPPLRSFNARFDHGRHLRQTNCATCHRPSRRGVAFSIPSGASAHVSCFGCHGPRTEIGGRNIGSCSTCHQPGRLVRVTEQAKAFSMNFDHSQHIRLGRMTCSACHTVRPGQSRGRQVSSPVAAMHFAGVRSQSCASCHNDKRAFGTASFSNCKRCHEGATFKF